MQGIRYDDVKFPKGQSSAKHSTYCTYWYVLVRTGTETHFIWITLYPLSDADESPVVRLSTARLTAWEVAGTWLHCNVTHELLFSHSIVKFRVIQVHTSTYVYILVCTGIYITLFSMYRYILVHTGTYWILTVQRMQSQRFVIDLVQGITYCHTPYHVNTWYTAWRYILFCMPLIQLVQVFRILRGMPYFGLRPGMYWCVMVHTCFIDVLWRFPLDSYTPGPGQVVTKTYKEKYAVMPYIMFFHDMVYDSLVQCQWQTAGSVFFELSGSSMYWYVRVCTCTYWTR